MPSRSRSHEASDFDQGLPSSFPYPPLPAGNENADEKVEVVTQQTKLIETLERKYEYNSDKLDTLKREVSELGKVVQKTKSKPKMAALKAKMVQIKRDEQALLQMQGQLDNVTLLKRQLQDSAITAETFRVRLRVSYFNGLR